jgi:hypothetical protein
MCWSASALSGKRIIVRDHKRAVCLFLGQPTDFDPSRAAFTLSAADTSFDWTRLVPKEPDFPNDAPTGVEIARWFAWSVGILLIAALMTIGVFKLVPRFNPFVVFILLSIALGALGTTAIGICFDRFAWTWPVSLYAAFRVVLAIGLDRTTHGWRHHVLARLILLLFIVCSYGYYRLCIVVGYAMAWGFLVGFVPALPFAVVANRISNRKRRCTVDFLGFTVYFFASGWIPSLKALI